jgi:tellurium resistance protein TerZ
MVSLSKGQSVSLAKRNGETLTNVTMGVGWDVKQKTGFFASLLGSDGGEIDLDASCLLFNANREPVDAVWFQQLRSKDGSVVHTGDNRTGAGDGDDEQIIVDLKSVPASVTSMVFTVNSFQGDTFDRIENAYCRLVDNASGQEIARYDLSGSGSHTAQVMAKLTRSDGGWSMTAIGAITSGRTFIDMMPVIVSAI